MSDRLQRLRIGQIVSESLADCPFCNRVVGGIHYDDCPRSSARMKALRAECARRMTPRLLWAKGHLTVRNTATGDVRELLNPGVPYVRPGNFRFLGGKPGGKAAEVKAFEEDALSTLRPAREDEDESEAS